MNNKKALTTQQLALYIKCECIAYEKRGKLVKVDTEHMPAVNFPTAGGIDNRQFVPPDQIQLILIPISQARLEHLQAIAKEHDLDEKDIRQFINVCDFSDIGTDRVFIPMGCDFRTAVCILNELRNFGYDCDDLIPQELAVNKLTLQNK